EVGIGVVFVFLLLSLVTSTLTEWVAGIFALRSKTLVTGIRELLNDPEGKGLAQAIYDHPLIKGLMRDGKLPSYIPSATFALALMGQPTTGAEDLLPKLQAWFDGAMDRVSGWYKRTAQLVTIGIGLFIVVLLNADTVMIADGLARDPAVRAGVVAAAQQAAS